MRYSSKFVRSERAQIITLAGVIIALTIVLLAVVVNTAAISGQRTAMQEVDDAHYVFKNVRDVYGDVLRQASDDETKNPFTNSTLATIETNMAKMCNAHGFSILFKDKYYDGSAPIPTATVMLIFSDGDTAYKDNVAYGLPARMPSIMPADEALHITKLNNDTAPDNTGNIDNITDEMKDGKLTTSFRVEPKDNNYKVITMKFDDNASNYSTIELCTYVKSYKRTPFVTIYAYQSEDNVNTSAHMNYTVSSTGWHEWNVTDIAHSMDGYGWMKFRVTCTDGTIRISEGRFNVTAKS